MHGTVHVLVALLATTILSGCNGAKAKEVKAINAPSGLELTARYVSGEKSVRVKRKGGPAIVDFSMPDTLPRVSGKKVTTTIKRFDFQYVMTNTLSQWMELIAKETTTECPPVAVQLDAVTPTQRILHVTVDQTEDGLVNVKIRDTMNSPIAQVVLKQPRGHKPEERVCMKTWNSKTIAKLASDMNDMRDALVADLSKVSGFNGELIGHRLSRKTPENPKEGEVG